MHKKRLLFPSKKAQITIFIILGIFVVFVFLFLIRLNAQATLKALETSREDILLKGFKKEALRIFVEDCLRDELRQGIRLLGKQGGRIWNDQPGGLEEFQSEINGVRDPHTGDRVAYGLLREDEKYATSPNAYPCNDLIEESPAYCKYLYEGITTNFPITQFGLPLAWESLLEEDLESYLKVKSHLCIETFLREKVKGADFTPTEFVLDVDLKSDGISVEAFYPLRFSSGKEKFFQLSRFDFFYPTSLRKFLQAAVFFPLQMDWQYIDFPYLEDSLKNPTFSIGEPPSTRTSFSANYRALGIQLESRKYLPPTQDTLFTFTAPFPHIVDTPEEFEFKMARQNRPPALDYISRESCFDGSDAEQYDYLVVKGADGEMGELRFELKARDPDLDDPLSFPEQGTYKSFYSRSVPSGSVLSHYDVTSASLPSTPATLTLTPEQVNDLAADTYTLTIIAQEPWTFADTTPPTPVPSPSPLLTDSQEVRIKIDEQLDPAAATLEIKYPWDSDAASYPTIISREDPFRVVVQAPGSSAAIQSLAVGGSPLTASDSNCFYFPTPTSPSICDFSSFTPATDLQEEHGDDTPYAWFLSPETLQAQFSLDYCGAPDTDPDTGITSHKDLTFTVQQCIPYVNDEHKFSYIPGTEFYKTSYSTGSTLPRTITDTDDTRSPYAASHLCCKTDGTIDVGADCSGPPNCGSLPDDFIGVSGAVTGVLAVEHFSTCSRGNLCGDGDSLPARSVNDKMTCGNPTTDLACGGAIASECQGKSAWDYVGTTGFCHGAMGCASFCSRSRGEKLFISPTTVTTMNDYANTNKIVKDDSGNFQIRCQANCDSSTSSWKYDAGFDGTFEGTCP